MQPQYVFIVYKTDGYNGEEIDKVFATLELAQKYLADNSHCFNRIDTFSVICN
jgi:hypothetical protein